MAAPPSPASPRSRAARRAGKAFRRASSPTGRSSPKRMPPACSGCRIISSSEAAMPQQSRILELHGITKSFGGVAALRGVDFTLSAGEIHGLVGENGAGKSTLMKIIAGVHPDFSGRFVLDGRETRFRSARDALSSGIAMVHQELSIAPDLTVAENVFLGNQPTGRLGIVQWRRMAHEAGELLARLGIAVDPQRRIGDLPIGLQQLIEIARVLFS